MPNEIREQPIFLPTQWYLSSLADQPLLSQVEPELICHSHPAEDLAEEAQGMATQERVHSGKEFLGIHRLGDVVIGSSLEQPHTISGTGETAHDENQGGGFLSKSVAKVKDEVQRDQIEIKDHKIESFLQDELAQSVGERAKVDPMSLSPEQRWQFLYQRWVLDCGQYPHDNLALPPHPQ